MKKENISYKVVLVVESDNGEITRTTLREYSEMALLTYELDDIVDDLSCLPMNTNGKAISVKTIDDAQLWSISLEDAINKIKNAESII